MIGAQVKRVLTLLFGMFLLAGPVMVFANDEKADMGMEVMVERTIAITVHNPEVDILATPTREGEFVYGSTSVSVSTNNETGYTMNMSTTTSENALVLNERNKILAISDDETVTAGDKAGFSKDKWGYTLLNKLDNTVGNTTTMFSMVPVVSAPVEVNSYDAPINKHITPVTFGAKISTDLLAGDYQNTVIFSATTNYVPNPTFSGISYMQEMTSEICAAETTPDKSAVNTTRISVPENNLVPEAVLIDERDGNEYLVRKLADGNCWMVRDLRIVGPRELTPETSDFTSGTFTLPTPVNTKFSTTRNANQIGMPSSDPKYGDGAYYSWFTATAGSLLESGTSNTSICPKGWQLPLRNTGTKSFDNLLFKAYGFKSGKDKPTQQPMQFNLSGTYDSRYLAYLGAEGRYWTASINNVTYVYALIYNINSEGVLANNYQKWNGFSVRCVAR